LGARSQFGRRHSTLRGTMTSRWRQRGGRCAP